MSATVTLRRATPEDAQRLFEWANDPAARSVSLQSAPIAWETHLAWLEGALKNERRLLYIAERDGLALGTARLDRDEAEASIAIVSFNVAAESRGRGVGRALLAALVVEARERGITTLHAFVKPENEASARAFLATGYTRVEASAALDRYELAV